MDFIFDEGLNGVGFFAEELYIHFLLDTSTFPKKISVWNYMPWLDSAISVDVPRGVFATMSGRHLRRIRRLGWRDRALRLGRISNEVRM